VDAAYVGLIGVAIGGSLGVLNSYLTLTLEAKRRERAEVRQAARLIDLELDDAHTTLSYLRREFDRKIKQIAEAPTVEETLEAYNEQQIPTRILAALLESNAIPTISDGRWRANQETLARVAERDAFLAVKSAYDHIARIRRFDEQLRRRGTLPNPEVARLDIDAALNALLRGRKALAPLVR
jgi:hypothetical protein